MSREIFYFFENFFAEVSQWVSNPPLPPARPPDPEDGPLAKRVTGQRATFGSGFGFLKGDKDKKRRGKFKCWRAKRP
ncbi:MAG: hypothetical protein A2Z19_06955 [Deltaproteobacteria bacterium RBG_16_54_18]|nr:MAG: hypothetical protein A2Z19_06955 [Deltaproteobacteria bacterium RBG_16_54_18]